jgi:hypothetical protein
MPNHYTINDDFSTLVNDLDRKYVHPGVCDTPDPQIENLLCIVDDFLNERETLQNHCDNILDELETVKENIKEILSEMEDEGVEERFIKELLNNIS